MGKKALIPLGFDTGWRRSNLAIMAMCCFCVHSHAQETDHKEADLGTLIDEIHQLRLNNSKYSKGSMISNNFS